jgi:small subunit ribosomal protein S17
MTDEELQTPAEESASDEVDAARGQSTAEAEPVIGKGSASDDAGVSPDQASSAPTGGEGKTVKTDAEPATRAARKVREGLVVSDKMDKTAVVAVVDRVRHAKYNKFVLRTKKLYVHDETNELQIGDRVRVQETRPLSKNKRWRLVEVLEKAK